MRHPFLYCALALVFLAQSLCATGFMRQPSLYGDPQPAPVTKTHFLTAREISATPPTRCTETENPQNTWTQRALKHLQKSISIARPFLLKALVLAYVASFQEVAAETVSLWIPMCRPPAPRNAEHFFQQHRSCLEAEYPGWECCRRAHFFSSGDWMFEPQHITISSQSPTFCTNARNWCTYHGR